MVECLPVKFSKHFPLESISLAGYSPETESEDDEPPPERGQVQVCLLVEDSFLLIICLKQPIALFPFIFQVDVDIDSESEPGLDGDRRKKRKKKGQQKKQIKPKRRRKEV